MTYHDKKNNYYRKFVLHYNNIYYSHYSVFHSRSKNVISSSSLVPYVTEHDGRGSGSAGRVVKFRQRNNSSRLRDIRKVRKFLDDGNCEMTMEVTQYRGNGLR